MDVRVPGVRVRDGWKRGAEEVAKAELGEVGLGVGGEREGDVAGKGDGEWEGRVGWGIAFRALEEDERAAPVEKVQAEEGIGGVEGGRSNRLLVGKASYVEAVSIVCREVDGEDGDGAGRECHGCVFKGAAYLQLPFLAVSRRRVSDTRSTMHQTVPSF